MNFNLHWEFILLWGGAIGLSIFNENYFSVGMILLWLGSFFVSNIKSSDITKFVSHICFLAANFTTGQQVISYLYSLIFFFGFIKTVISIIVAVLFVISGAITFIRTTFGQLLEKNLFGKLILTVVGFMTRLLLNVLNRLKWIFIKILSGLKVIIDRLRSNLFFHYSNSANNIFSVKAKNTLKSWGSMAGMKIFQAIMTHQFKSQFNGSNGSSVSRENQDKMMMPNFNQLNKIMSEENLNPVESKELQSTQFRNFKQADIKIDDNDDLDDLGTNTNDKEVSRAEPKTVSKQSSQTNREALKRKLAEKRAGRLGKKTGATDLLRMNPDELMKMVESGQKIAVDKKQMKQVNRMMASMLQGKLPENEFEGEE